MRSRLTAVLLAVMFTTVAGGAIAKTLSDDAVASTRSTYYAQGVADGKAQVAPKAPVAVQAIAHGACVGKLDLAWFDASMNVTQVDVDNYAARPHDCAGTRFLGSMSVTRYTGETGTSYVFTITQNGHEAWWVFTVNAAGQIVDIQ